MRPDASDLDRALDALYAASPDTFVERRDELVRELREKGQDDAAKALRARRKPTQIAWVLNQLSREQPDRVGREAAGSGGRLRSSRARRPAAGEGLAIEGKTNDAELQRALANEGT